MKLEQIIQIIIFLLLLHGLYKLCNMNNIDLFSNTKVKILNLVLYSHNKEYDMMYSITREFYKKYSNVTTIYYLFSPTITDDYMLVGDILYIKGNESYVPGILDKTVKAFKYASLYYSDYDFIIRTNISTIVNFDILSNKLNNTITYGASNILHINKGYRDPAGGIVNDKYAGTSYASGTGIIFSKDFFNDFMKVIDNIDYGVIDDVAIGFLIHTYFPNIKITNFQDYITYVEEVTNLDYDKIIFYRNRSSTDRSKDVINMKKIVTNL